MPDLQRGICNLVQVLVVTPTADGNSVDVDYEASNQRLDAWAARHGVPQVRQPSWRSVFGPKT